MAKHNKRDFKAITIFYRSLPKLFAKIAQYLVITPLICLSEDYKASPSG